MGKKLKEKPLTRRQWLRLEASERRALGAMGSPLGSADATRALGVDKGATKGIGYKK